MEFFRRWLLGTLACAMLVSMICQLCPEGSVRKLARFTGGLLLLLAMLRPLADVEIPDAARGTDGYREAVARLEAELDRTGKNALADGIAAELEAYIEDKAESLGTEVRATVEMSTDGDAPLPARVTLRGAYNEALAEAVASELGVTKEGQLWIESE